MAKLFEEVFSDGGSGDIALVFDDCDNDMGTHEDTYAFSKLQCHSLILMQHPYFYKMLSNTSALREGRTKELHFQDPREDILELIKFIYTGQIDINPNNVGGLLSLADKYCMDDVVELCLKFLKENFDADSFFSFYNFTALNTAFQDKLKEQLMGALKLRRNLCAVTEDERWRELPVECIEEILSMDDLPISSEAEVLTLIAHWGCGQRSEPRDITRLMGTFRRCEGLRVPISKIEVLMQAMGFDLLSSKEPRTGSALWDPPLVLHRQEAAGNIATATIPVEKAGSNYGEICHQLGPKDYLQQEPGWMHPGVHRIRITLQCTSWSHRERRLLRGSREAGTMKRVFECSPAKAPGHERSPSPPPSFKVRMPQLDMNSFDTFDANTMPDILESERRVGGGVRKNLSQDKIDHELVDHQIICSVVSGQQRHGVRFMQRDPNAIYLAEDLQGKHGVHIGGTTASITFDLELVIGNASKNGINRCRFAVLREKHTLIDEWFDASAKVPLRFHISSASFDSNSSYTVTARWHPPTKAPFHVHD
jgi:hypothetical protein